MSAKRFHSEELAANLSERQLIVSQLVGAHKAEKQSIAALHAAALAAVSKEHQSALATLQAQLQGADARMEEMALEMAKVQSLTHSERLPVQAGIRYDATHEESEKALTSAMKAKLIAERELDNVKMELERLSRDLQVRRSCNR